MGYTDQNKIVLLVEDHADDVALALHALGIGEADDQVVVVRDGVEALDYLFYRGPYAGRDADAMPVLVLLDLKLPRLNGLEVLRALRADSRTKLLPVVILTTSEEEQDIVDSYTLGANSYIRKPVDFTEFCEVMRHLRTYWLSINKSPFVREQI